MAIVYLYGEDEKHYKESGIEKLKKRFNQNKLNVSFQESDIETLILTALKDVKDIYILTPIYFYKIIEKYFSFIRVVKLENENGILTSQDIRLGITAEEKLKLKLNSSITKPKTTFKDYGGAKDLVQETEDINNFFKLGIPVKGIFLAGLPGTGKTFFAKCLAGQLNRYLIELNLTKFMKSPNSIILIEEFFDFFKTNPGDYIIWLDEIEKMFTGTEESTQLLGTLLTKINEFNSISSTIKSTAFIVATANNVKELSERNPELFRNGRFDILISLNPPKSDGAKEIFNIYINSSIKKNREIILNAVYFSAMNNLKVSSDNNNKGLLKKIHEYTQENIVAIKSFIEENNILNKKKFVETISIKLKENAYFVISMLNDLEKFDFKFDIDKTVSETFNLYREKCHNKINFPYVPAEIEYFVSSMYKHYLFFDTELNQDTIKNYLSKIKPLQASMKDQMSEMDGVTFDFRKVN